MNKLTTIVAATLCSITTLWAQEPSPIKDTIATFKVENSDDVVLSSNEGSVSINIAGYSIALSKHKDDGFNATQFLVAPAGISLKKVEHEDPNNFLSEVKREKNCKITFASNSQIGLIGLTSPDYSAYSASEQGFLDLRLSKSIYYGLDLVGLRTPLNEKGSLRLKTGVNLMCYNFTFEDDITLKHNNGIISPVAIDSSCKKSKLTTAYLAIPLSVAIDITKKFTIEPGVYAGIIVNSHTKHKFPKVKSDYLRGVNQAIAGASLTATYNSIGLYCNYNLTSLFEQGRGPETQAFSIGLGFKL